MNNNSKKRIKTYIEYYQPKIFFKITKTILPWLLFITLTFLLTSFYLGIITGPVDFQQGENFKIIYIHIPAAWCCLSLYTILTLCSILYLLTKNPIHNLTANSLAEIGCMFTFLTLCSGSLWGAPTWGTYWVWDARLTSVLILFFVYLAYIMISKIKTEKTASNSAIVAIFGFINIPIIKYSVDWWTTLHQPASITINKVAIDILILTPILLLTITFLSYTLYLTIIYIRQHLIQYKTYTIQKLKT